MSEEKKETFDKHRLLKEVRDEVAKDGPNLQRFMEMVASFKDVIPEEYKRYQAAITALKQASGIKEADILEAADAQLGALGRSDSILADTMGDRRDELNKCVEKTKEMDSEIAVLQSRLDDITRERKAFSDNRIEKEKEIKTIEDNFKAVINHLDKEIRGVKARIEKYLSGSFKPEAHAPRPTSSEPQLGGGGLEPGASAQSASPKSAKSRPCSVCNATMDWYSMKKMWKCFTCGHEEK